MSASTECAAALLSFRYPCNMPRVEDGTLVLIKWSVAECRGSWVVGRGRGSWVWVWVNVVGKKKYRKKMIK